MFDIKNKIITSSHEFLEGRYHIFDIVAIDNTHYLIAGDKGLLKTTKD